MMPGKQREALPKDNYSEPLLFLQETNIAIYPDRIQLCKKKDNSLSAVDTTILSVHDHLEAAEKTIPFKSDLAFRIDERRRKVALISINNDRTEFEFPVEKASQLIIIQEILRRKLCEIGFEEKFKIIKELGKGATAKVYLVERLSDSRLFAAKIISIKEASNKDYVPAVSLRKPSQTRLKSSNR